MYWAEFSSTMGGVQEGPVGTLHPKASLKPNTGEVVVGSSPLSVCHGAADQAWRAEDEDRLVFHIIIPYHIIIIYRSLPATPWFKDKDQGQCPW